MFDCASAYANEAAIGAVFEDRPQSGTRREELFIASMLWNDMHGRGDVLLSCAKTLKDLMLDYLDMYFVHWPFPNFHPQGAPPDFHNEDAKPYIHEAYMETGKSIRTTSGRWRTSMTRKGKGVQNYLSIIWLASRKAFAAL